MVLLWAQTESMIKHRILGVQILRQSQVNVLRDKMDVHSVYIYVYLDIYIYIYIRMMFLLTSYTEEGYQKKHAFSGTLGRLRAHHHCDRTVDFRPQWSCYWWLYLPVYPIMIL
jgi:hypothetical protein